MTCHNGMKTSIKHGIDKIGLPLIVTSSKPNLCFLIDTGATHNIVFSFVYEGLTQCFKSTQDATCLMGIEGSVNEVIQVKATIAFEDKETLTDFFVLDASSAVMQIQKEHGVQIHGIIGIPFLTQNEWILDFKQLTISN